MTFRNSFLTLYGAAVIERHTSLHIPFTNSCPDGQFGGTVITLRKAFSSAGRAVHELATKYSNGIMKIIIFYFNYFLLQSVRQ